MMIPTIIIGNHKNHNGSCNSNILLMIKNNTCRNSNFIALSPIEKIKKMRYNLSTKRALGLFPVEGFLLEEVQVFFSISVFLFQ